MERLVAYVSVNHDAQYFYKNVFTVIVFIEIFITRTGPGIQKSFLDGPSLKVK
jgi:hypothetical protein